MTSMRIFVQLAADLHRIDPHTWGSPFRYRALSFRKTYYVYIIRLLIFKCFQTNNIIWRTVLFRTNINKINLFYYNIQTVMTEMFDLNELVKRAIKYLVEGLAVAICAMLIPKKALSLEEIMIIALTAAATFSILDVFIPSMGSSARNGAGMTLGSSLVGGIRIA